MTADSGWMLAQMLPEVTSATAIHWQGFRDVLIVLGAILAIYLGYLLYKYGVDTTSSTEAQLRTRLLSITLNGAGPGLGAMALGGFILVTALATGGARSGDQTLGSQFLNFTPPVDNAQADEATQLDPVALVRREEVKKRAEQSLSAAGEVDRSAVRDVAAAIRDESVAELAGLLVNAGAENEFQTLASESQLGWGAYVDEMIRSRSFAPAMLSLRALGLVAFDGANVRSASLTGRGVQVAEHLQSVSASLPSVERVELPEVASPPPDTALVELHVDGDPVEGTFDDAADNWYALRLNTRQREYVIRTTAPTQADGADTIIRLYDESGEIGVDDDGGPGTYSVLRETLEPGEYYLRVSSFGRAPGAYRLAVESEDSGVATAQTTSAGLTEIVTSIARQPLPADGRRVTGRLTDAMDMWFEVNVAESGMYVIETHPPTSLDVGVDTVITLYNEDGSTVLGEDDDGNPNGYSLLHEQLSRDVTYLVQVSDFWGEAGEFAISVGPVPER